MPVGSAALIALGGELIGGWFGHRSQGSANKANIKLQREQQAWEAMMSNTAVQRRADDIQRAGGNRALAFTNGSEASTPSVTPAKVEPTFKPEWVKGALGSAMTTRAQLDMMKAQTQNISADTRLKNINAGIQESMGGMNTAAQIEQLQKKNAMFDIELRKAMADADVAEATRDRMRELTPRLAQLMQTNAQLSQFRGKMQELTYESAKAMADTLGLKGEDASTIAKIIMGLWSTFVTR